MSQALTQAILRRIIQDAMDAPDDGRRCGTLSYGSALKRVSWVILIFFVGLTAGCVFMAPPAEKAACTAIFAAFCLLGVFLVMEAHGVHITYDEDGIRTRSPWRRPRRVAWSEVTSCDYSEMNQWYRIHTRHQGLIRMSLMLRGVSGLLRMLPCGHPSYPPGAASGRTA